MSGASRVLTNLQRLAVMPRDSLPPPLAPRQPKTALGWTMQKLRLVDGASVRQTAKEFGCNASHISRVERGDTKPSRALVQFYEERFEADGLLNSLFEVAEQADEQKRQRSGGHRSRQPRAVEGDATAFVDQTIPHGSVIEPGGMFVMTWRIRNCGTVPWIGRRLERQGPLTGPGLITSQRYVDIPDTDPSEIADVSAPLKAPTYDCSSIAYFKMVDAEGFLSFPDVHQLGLDVLVRVERNTSGTQ
jgi:transcriptional regulator with XRE-family HTH domain